MTLRSLTALGALLACILAATPQSRVAAAGAPESTPFGGASRIGAIFGASAGRPDHHFCSGAVVDSPSHDIVVTAAHCVIGPGTGRARGGLTFVPGYHDGLRPFGTWSVATVVAGAAWTTRGSTDDDVAFLILRPDAAGHRIQDATGAEALAFNPATGTRAVTVGYPSRTERPVFCASTLRAFRAHQLEFDCPGLPGGTSGGPMLAGVDAAARGRGAVVGVIGGYEGGGDTDDVSYTSYFGPAIAAVYRAALAHG
ncbi:trypsin-like serine peptidase [Streptacidiphilus rugosus]|uniref:trypsin-like serine peptidase n=1 Tax=Streptacidiphilus rugosus TaxID=405783 RepID=UPI0018DDB5FF|nr:trypsin-like peptidase domain-containing protein [Streptacidiphilus rugosus]